MSPVKLGNGSDLTRQGRGTDVESFLNERNLWSPEETGRETSTKSDDWEGSWGHLKITRCNLGLL